MALCPRIKSVGQECPTHTVPFHFLPYFSFVPPSTLLSALRRSGSECMDRNLSCAIRATHPAILFPSVRPKPQT